jgi:hypothetical protein
MHQTQYLFRTCDPRSANRFEAVLSRVSNNQVELLSRKHTSATQPGQLQTFAGAVRKVFVDSQQIQSTREPLYLCTVRLRPSTIVIDVAGSDAFPGPILKGASDRSHFVHQTVCRADIGKVDVELTLGTCVAQPDAPRAMSLP